jgi:hypothetical protein
VDARVAENAAPSPVPSGHELFLDYFGCPGHFGTIERPHKLSETQGYFAFAGATCYGHCAEIEPARDPSGCLVDVFGDVAIRSDQLQLPFDFAEVVKNLREERYYRSPDGWFEVLTDSPAVRRVYYALRPLLTVGVRKHLQRLRLRGWEKIAFPSWPVDDSVDRIMRVTMALLQKQAGVTEIPFIWFWPDGAPGCAIMTHDVEGAAGANFCRSLADLDESFGIASAFQLIPGNPVEGSLVDVLRRRGFEVNLHDLAHDGYLFQDREEFGRRASEINRFATQFQCRGFRSGAMYREQSWFDAFEFSYDMSVPNAAHLEPQRGGCCTVLPYFIGNILELPLTTTQDYSLFHILSEYSVDRWKQQTELLLSKNGFVSFIAHPDYLIEQRARAVYVDLLGYLSRLQSERHVWIALPGQVNDWWRARRRMALVWNGSSWRIEGPDSDRARIAYATLDGDRVVYRVPGASGDRRADVTGWRKHSSIDAAP